MRLGPIDKEESRKRKYLRRRIVAQLFFFALSLLVACAKKKNVLFVEDINFIYKTISENHPGIYNNQDPEFNENFKKSYAIEKKKIIKANDVNDYKLAIDTFTKSFHDEHLRVIWHDAKIIRPRSSSDFSVINLPENLAWISLPTFDPNTDQQESFRELDREISALRKIQYIAFDLRGNQGGNSEFGSKIVDSLFGEKLANRKRCIANKNTYIDWRTSKGNADHIDSLLARYKSNWLKQISVGLRDSLKQGGKYFREFVATSCDTKYQTKEIKTRISPTKIIIIIDSKNVSAALDFIDEIKMMTTETILIGQKTRADRLYMEARSVALPSGLGDFQFPIKVYRNRLRADNEPYFPDMEYEDIANTQALQRFIVEKIKNGEL